jgi:hypothetical protein
MELKTLKDIFKELDREIAGVDYWMSAFLSLNRELKQEAIKWVKTCGCLKKGFRSDFSCSGCDRFVRFFNITEEDLK